MTKGKTVTIASNAVVAKLVDPITEVEVKVAEMLSYSPAGRETSRMGKKQGWDSKKSFYSFKKKTFPAGFAQSIVGSLTKKGYYVNWVKKPLPEPLGDTRPIVDSFGYDPKYSYQPETADKLVKYGQIIANVATGGGKSRIARICYKRIQRNTLFLTTRSVLMYQMKDNFESLLSESVGVVGDSVWSPKEGFTVGMVQTLSARLEKKTMESELERVVTLENDAIARKIETYKRSLQRSKKTTAEIIEAVKKYRKQLHDAQESDEELVKRVKQSVVNHNAKREETIEYLKSVEFLILEEAHEAGSDEYYNVCMACTNALYRLSLTATAFKRADEESNMRLMAVSGPVAVRVTEKKLIDLGVLARPIFYYHPVQKIKGVYRTTGWRDAQDKGIVNNELRNQDVVNSCVTMSEYGLTSMVLVLRKEHGRVLKKKLQAHGLRASFIDGDKSNAERKDALKKLAQGDIDVLIGTTILDVGVDVPSVGAIILAGGGKAEIALRQRVGRGLRAKKSGPNVAFVFDFHDRHNDHLTKHAASRRKIIQDTPGFAENIVSELDIESYGFKKIKATS